MRYYGCKTKLLDFLGEGVTETGINHGSVFCDLFSGTVKVFYAEILIKFKIYNILLMDNKMKKKRKV